MKLSIKLCLGIATAAASGLAIAAAFAHPADHADGMPMFIHEGAGPMHGPMAMQHGDASFRDDMQLVHAMLVDNTKIKRTVENLPDGIRTVTESDDPAVARSIKAHVASVGKRLKEGRLFNLFSPTLPVLFENKDKIKTTVDLTEKGATVIQTSEDTKVVAALQAHAQEVNELVRDGMAAMMRNMRNAMMARAQRN
ncbi:MAG TPA: hypothetical protein VEC75_10600 [Stellaceae bacterium]|nr:hypothetical protein [Stellaceae bacterium]